MKIGLFFGSFNPIHVGHLMIANYMLNETKLEQIWFIVSPHNPHKLKSTLLADHHRLALVQRAIDDQPLFKVDDIEFHLSQPSYTIDTLVRLKDKHPNKEFALIMGEDNLQTLDKWKNYEQILDKHTIFVYPRNGDKAESNNLITHKNIVFCDNVPVLHLSASQIRALRKQGKSVKYMVTDPVLNYMEEMHFYEK